MAEKGREGKEGNLEIVMSSVNCDVMKLPYAGADKKNAEKIGKMKIYEYTSPDVDGAFFRKEVYDKDGKLKDNYFAGSDMGTTEKLKLAKTLDISGTYYIYLDNQGVNENG